MIRTLIRWLNDGARKRHEGMLRDARKTCLEAYENAVNRGDTRTQGRALMELRQITTECLAASLSASQHPTQAGGSR
jgi:hypothetical protein